MRIKNHIHIKGFALSLAVKQRLEPTRNGLFYMLRIFKLKEVTQSGHSRNLLPVFTVNLTSIEWSPLLWGRDHRLNFPNG